MIQVHKITSIQSILKLLNSIPEFSGTFSEEMFHERLSADSIMLVATINEKPVGCKIAYNRFEDGSYYSWLGGVLPEFRNKGVAQLLNNEMEFFAKEKGYTSIIFKTRNKFKPMLHFAIKNGYHIVDIEQKRDILENRIILRKSI